MVKKLAIFSPKSAKNGHSTLIGARWGEIASRHVVNFDQWEHAKT